MKRIIPRKQYNRLIPYLDCTKKEVKDHLKKAESQLKAAQDHFGPYYGQLGEEVLGHHQDHINDLKYALSLFSN